MCKTLSPRYYQKNERQKKKKLAKDIRIFREKKKKKSNNMAVNLTKISQKMKNKSWLSIEKNTIEQEKRFIIIIKKHFNLENFGSSF